MSFDLVVPSRDGSSRTAERFDYLDEIPFNEAEGGYVVDLETGLTVLEFVTAKNGRSVWWCPVNGDLFEVNSVGGLNLVPENVVPA